VVALADASSRHHSVDLNAELGDFIVWRRDQVPAYQLASCVDDLDLAINFWVRGEDLRVSSAAQLWLRRRITDEVAPLSFLHHPLLTREGGAKLSKSEADVSLASLREQGLRLDEVYSAFAAWWGLPHAKEIASLSELQHAFSTHHSSEVS
jgi:glutamyl-tRNA synthetase